MKGIQDGRNVQNTQSDQIKVNFNKTRRKNMMLGNNLRTLPKAEKTRELKAFAKMNNYNYNWLTPSY